MKVIPEQTIVPAPVESKKDDKKPEAIPVVLPSVKGNTVLTAEVLKTGPEVKEITVGSTVIFSPYGFDEVQINGEKLVIIQEDMILAYEVHGQNKGSRK